MTIKESRIQCKLAYYLPKETEEAYKEFPTEEDVAEFCSEQEISYVTMSLSRFSAAVAQTFHNKGIRCCIVKCAKIGDILSALDNGADIVCSVYADVYTLKELTR